MKMKNKHAFEKYIDKRKRMFYNRSCKEIKQKT